jgi:hypothetical protein
MKDGDPTKYLKDLVFELETMYETTTQNVNGTFRNNLDVDGSQYIPTLKGGTVEGTFTYSRQSAYVLRQGLMTDVWYDIIWSTIGGATGQLRMNLPYKSTPHLGLFFSGVAYMDNANFGAGKTYVVGATVNGTFDLSYQSYGSLTTTGAISVYANGRVGGHVRYIGVDDEQ